MGQPQRKQSTQAQAAKPRQAKQRPAKAGAARPAAALAAVHARNDFFRAGIPFAWRAAVGGAIAMVIAALTLVYQVARGPDVHYFAMNQDGTVLPLVPLSEPNLSDDAVANWLSSALVKTFHYGWTDANMRLNDAAREFFTQTGSSALFSELKNSGVLDAVREKRLFSSIAIENTPVISNKAVLGGSIYGWRLQVPVVMTYRTERAASSERYLVNVTVVRRSQLENPYGIGIEQLVMEPNK